jgi:thioredoxin-like negative regulator of GroEL
MIKYYGVYGVLFGLALLSSPLLSQGKLENLQQVQLLSQDECVIIQVNADWNARAAIDLGKLKNCKWFNASIDDKSYGVIIANEWKIKSVPTIIMFEYGKEVKRFEAGLSFNLDKEKIMKQINEEIDEIMLRRFQ